MTHLKGRVAVVTGSSRSMGGAMVKGLAEDGADVVVNARSSKEEAEAMAAECRALGVKAVAVVADVSTEQGVNTLADAALKEFGKVDILVNNVGVSPRQGNFLELSYEDWKKVFDINLNSQFLTAKRFAPSMIENKWGRIINLSGHAHLNTNGGGVHVKASKAAIDGLTRGQSGTLAKYGITVNAIAPHAIDTPERHNKYYNEDRNPKWDAVSRGVDKIPVGRLGKMSEMAALVRFLCSDDAGYLTAQTYLVNGGIHAL